MNIVAMRDGQQLLDLGGGKGAIHDLETDLTGKAMGIASLWARGYWTPVEAARKYDESEPRDEAGRWTAAAEAVSMAPSVKWGFEPDFPSESRSYPQEGPANGFTTRTREYPAQRGTASEPYTSTDIAAYDADGKLVGTFSVAHGAEQDGYVKIAVRPDAQRQGWGTRLLAEAERQGVDLARIAGQNRYTPSGRALMTAYLSSHN